MRCALSAIAEFFCNDEVHSEEAVAYAPLGATRRYSSSQKEVASLYSFEDPYHTLAHSRTRQSRELITQL